MTIIPRTIALIVAAGKGVRAGGELPKQYTQLGGKALLAWSVEAFASHPDIDAIYVVIGAGQETLLGEALGERAVFTVIGGAERADSVRAGLEAIAADAIAEDKPVDYVLIHDAARPLLTHMVINRLRSALEAHQGACPTLGCFDTLATVSGGATGLLGANVDRTSLVRVQTPQAFHFEAILAAHRTHAGAPPTDDAQMARAYGLAVAQVEGDVALEKITEPQDFARAEALLASRRISRTGMGFDVHRLEVGEELWLCGVRVPHDKGLSGHSDADVALHALTDALLGACAEGDIGDHFPPSDPQWRGAASHRFVEYARDLITTKGGVIDHVDMTIICEAPKIGPHRDAMCAAIAAMLRVNVDQVSVKATTTERLGLTGRGEGIAAQAIATVRL